MTPNTKRVIAALTKYFDIRSHRGSRSRADFERQGRSPQPLPAHSRPAQLDKPGGADGEDPGGPRRG